MAIQMLNTTSYTASVPAYLEVLDGPGRGKKFELTKEILTIGRAGDNDISLLSNTLDATHAYLKNTPKGWLLQDNLTKRGMRVNKQKVTEVYLKSGDLIHLGELALRFYETKEILKPVELTLAGGGGNKGNAVSTREIARPQADNARANARVKSPNLSDLNNSASEMTQVGFTESEVQIEKPRDRHVDIEAIVQKRLEGHQRQMQFLLSLFALTIGFLIWNQWKRNQPNQVAQKEVKPAREVSSVEIKPLPVFEPVIPKVVTPTRPPAPVVTKKELKIQKRRSADEDELDLSNYVRMGQDYLHEGDFVSAATAFQAALVIDPKNSLALAGLEACERKQKVNIAKVKPAAQERKPAKATDNSRDEKRRQVMALLKEAQTYFDKKKYRDAIELAEKVRSISVVGETAYLNEAKQILDRSRQAQKEEFDPFIDKAKELLKQGKFQEARDLCEEMLRVDASLSEANECMRRVKQGLGER